MPPGRDLEVIPLDTPGAIEIVFGTSELLALCPVTSQRDLYDMKLTIEGTATMESKSLKLYLASWDQEEILAEDLTNSIADDVFDALAEAASSVTVTLHQHVRGGLDITVTAQRRRG
ncbi:MAG: preQ(1) synthase [Acidimicrobiales bacterium]